MKKKLLLVTLVAPLLMVSAQWTQTGGVVKISPKTTKYVGGNYEVKATATSTLNEGNVNVRGNFTTPNVANKFTNKFEMANPKNYGQLIVNQASTVSGFVSGEFRNSAHGTFYYQPLAIPYSGLTAKDIADASGIPVANQEWQNHPKDGNYSPNRHRNPVFSWENERYQLDDLAKAEAIVSVKPYSINQGLSTLPRRISTYTGTLTNAQLTYAGTAFPNPVVNNHSENQFGELAYTYLDDMTKPAPSGWTTYDANIPVVPSGPSAGYGNNVYYFGNPYTSNLDLEKVFPNSSSASHIFQFVSNSYDNTNTSGSTSGITLVAVKVGGAWNTTGSTAGALTVRPFHTFGVRMSGAFTHNIPENAKTFKDRAGSAITYKGADKLYQIEMNLLNEDSNKISRFYIIAHDSYQAAAKAGNEAYNLTIKDNTGFFTLQENEDGSVAEELRHNKVLINGINTSYVAKPINVVMQVTKPGTFTIKSILSDDLLSSGNRFYFEDQEAGQILEITPEFSYVFDAKESSDDRFKIYWNGLPDEMGVEDTAIAKTLVYKDGRDYKVRFDNNWKQADVYVYNMIGQLVHVAKKVDTRNDYLLPINGDPAAYIVKVMGDNGDVVTKKIVK